MATSLPVDLNESEEVTFWDQVHVNKPALWDPQLSTDWDGVKPTEQCFLRIKRDIMSVYKDPTPGMCIVPDKDDMTKLHALITGPFDTPYEGGFFYFVIRCPPDYPIKPPRVKLMTTGSGSVRFNPNLYKNGKVCLSILGTWSGPGWSPANSISSVLISIQSLMNEKPYHNEPGFEKERRSGDAKRYNEIIQHETLRVAVCEMLENTDSCPQALREVMEASFGNFYDYYVSTCIASMEINSQPMQDPFGEKRGSFNYKSILEKLERLKNKYCVVVSDSSSELDSTSESESEHNEDQKNSEVQFSASQQTAAKEVRSQGSLNSGNHTSKSCSSCSMLSEKGDSLSILSNDRKSCTTYGNSIGNFVTCHVDKSTELDENECEEHLLSDSSHISFTGSNFNLKCKSQIHKDYKHTDSSVEKTSTKMDSLLPVNIDSNGKNKENQSQESSLVNICLTG